MIHIYSEKLQKMLDFNVGSSGRLIPVGAVPLSGTNIMFAWNNSSSDWVDNGWNNSSSNWQDNGWNNSSGSWIDQGWVNTGGRWQDNGWSNSSSNWGDSGNTGGGCFITTACVEQKGMADDCYEMQILRRYRDILVEKDDAFRGKVLEYYRQAPLIIQGIEAENNKNEIYGMLYDEMIKPCVDFLENGNIEQAKTLYLNFYEKLSKQYLTSR